MDRHVRFLCWFPLLLTGMQSTTSACRLSKKIRFVWVFFPWRNRKVPWKEVKLALDKSVKTSWEVSIIRDNFVFRFPSQSWHMMDRKNSPLNWDYKKLKMDFCTVHVLLPRNAIYFWRCYKLISSYGGYKIVKRGLENYTATFLPAKVTGVVLRGSHLSMNNQG